MDKKDYSVCLSVLALKKEFGDDLEHTRIEYTFDEKEGEYYNLYNDKNELCCMDGEEVLIIKDGGSDLTFVNQNGLKDVEFKLTLAEFIIASFRYYGMEYEYELNRAWIYDEDENTIGETNFVVPGDWLEKIFDKLNSDGKFICKYDHLEDFFDTYEPETDGELIYRQAIKDRVLKEDLGVVMYDED